MLIVVSVDKQQIDAPCGFIFRPIFYQGGKEWVGMGMFGGNSREVGGGMRMREIRRSEKQKGRISDEDKGKL